MITKILISLLLTTILTTPARCDDDCVYHCEQTSCGSNLCYSTDDFCRRHYTPTDCANAPGCGWSHGDQQCNPCPQGYFSDLSESCSPCSGFATSEWSTVAYGARSSDYCKKECTETISPLNTTIFKPVTKHIHYGKDQECTYEIECNNRNVIFLCKAFHDTSGETTTTSTADEYCSSNTITGRNCPNGTGVTIFNHVTSQEMGPYCTACTDGFHLVNDVSKTSIDGYTLCDTSLYTECKANSHDCNTDPNVPKSATLNDTTHNGTVSGTTHNGTVSGTATWKPGTEDDYDYSECTITINTTNPVPNGTGTATCKGWDGEKWTNCTYTVTTCNPGYYKDENRAAKEGCVAVGKGYYTDANAEGKRTPCPAGSTTSTETATAFTECHLTGGVTQICDSNACFKLPGDDLILLTRIPPKS